MTALTKYGLIDIKPTQSNHVYVCTEGDEDRWLTVRRVKYAGSFHLYRWHDGLFHVGEQSKGEYRRKLYSVFLKHSDWLERKSTDSPSDLTRDILVVEVERVVNEWVKANPQAMYDAQTKHLMDEKESAIQKASDAQDLYNVAVRACDEATNALADHLLSEV